MSIKILSYISIKYFPMINSKININNFLEELNKIQFNDINPKNEIKESNNIDTDKNRENAETDISKLILNIN